MTTFASPTDGASAAPGPPHSLEAEQSVLGAILLSERAMYALVIEEGLKPEDFYRERHRLIYAAMLSLYEESEPIDVLTVSERLRAAGNLEQAGGQATIDALAGSVPAAGHARQYARIVREHALMRRLLNTTYAIQESVAQHSAAPRELVEQAERAMLDVAHDDRQQDFRSIEEVLDVEVDKLHRLSLEHTALTGTPSGFKDLDEVTGGFQPGNLIIIAARPAMGKCLVGSTRVYDAMSGARHRLDELVARHERGDAIWVAALGPDLSLRPRRVDAVARNGRKPVFRVTTRLGREVVATANHPLLTLDGWKRVDELRPGMRVGVPRALPRRDRPHHMPEAELVLLAALIADGSLGGRTPRFTAAASSAVLEEVRWAAAELGAAVTEYRRGTNVQVSLVRQPGARENPVTSLLRRHGLMGRRSADKFVPEAIFSLAEDQIARFLGVLFACDGYVYASERVRHVGYCTISERLARDVQHLLLRLGIVGAIRSLPRKVYAGTDKVAREVRITHQASLGAFCALVPVPGKRRRQRELVAALAAVGRKSYADTVPAAVWARVDAARGDRSWAELSRRAGFDAGHNWHVGTRGVTRERLALLAEVIEDEQLRQLATSDVWWDEIVAVEPAGEEETFDVSVPGDRNFVADDVIVHNSALVANIAENAAIEHNRPIALFSLEMSESELAQRFLASQARIKGEQLRRGRVPDRQWPKILEAAQSLAKAPIFIDDSSDVGLLEIRAKARRLHQQHGLGLVIVDYLQLLRADARIESRVQQIGEMSRGLKILARELETPVIALSQLSRAVESRNPPIPQLSDLRESGNLEQDADVVAFIYRPEYYARRGADLDDDDPVDREGEADIVIAKHRNGPIDTVTLTFHKEYPKFMNYAGERFR
jgi:replicative DNA helicase